MGCSYMYSVGVYPGLMVFVSYTGYYKSSNQNYNKILECDWLSVALIIAFIGQFTRHAWCYWTVYASFARALI